MLCKLPIKFLTSAQAWQMLFLPSPIARDVSSGAAFHMHTHCRLVAVCGLMQPLQHIAACVLNNYC